MKKSPAGLFSPWPVVVLTPIVSLGPLSTGGAATLRVPLDFSLPAAIAAAAPGDTVAVSPGSYDRVPPPFSKQITILGLGTPADPAVLVGLEAGLCRIENIAFRQKSGFETSDLVEALDSVSIEDCSFQGVTALGIRLQESDAAAPRNVSVTGCRFELLSQAARFEVDAGSASGASFEDCTFTNCVAGIRVESIEEPCPPPESGPPPFDEEHPRVRITNCTFQGMTTFAVHASNLASAVRIEGSTFSHHATGLELRRAGGIVVSTAFRDNENQGTGIRMLSARLVMRSSDVRHHALGISSETLEGCPPGDAAIGGDLPSSCAIAGNNVNLRTDSPIGAESNFWGFEDCDLANGSIQGQSVRIIVNESRTASIDCGVPVQPTTWSGLKARFTQE